LQTDAIQKKGRVNEKVRLKLMLCSIKSPAKEKRRPNRKKDAEENSGSNSSNKRRSSSSSHCVSADLPKTSIGRKNIRILACW